MARKRMISPCIWTDDKCIELTIAERLLFIGMWNFSDDEGIMCYKPKQIKAQIFPVDDITHEQVNEMLVRIHEVGLIQFGNNNTLIRITNWTRYQKINRPTPSNYTFRKGIIEDSLNAHGGLTTSIVERKLIEVNRKEDKAQPLKKVSPNNLLPYSDRVNKFYDELEQDKAYLKQLKEAYPNVGIAQQLRSSKMWLLSNTNKAKKNFKKFVNNWMANQMEYSKNRPNDVLPDEEDKRVEKERVAFRDKMVKAEQEACSDDDRKEALGGWVKAPNKYKEAHDKDNSDNAEPLKANIDRLLSNRGNE